MKNKSDHVNKFTINEENFVISVQMTIFITKFSDVLKDTQFYTEQGLVCSLFQDRAYLNILSCVNDYRQGLDW
jgi:hypothetical protein